MIKKIEEKMRQTTEHFQTELKHLRTGKADPGMLDGILVQAYGTQMKLKELATVTSPEPRQLLITPFDAQNLGAIRKGIETSQLNIPPIVEGSTVRLQIPPMDQNMRSEMVKQAKKKGEEAKVGIRNARREGNDLLKQQKASGEIPEDRVKSTETEIQKLTDKYCKKIDEIISCKEKDIMAI